MSYTPKHAKPASLRDAALGSQHRPLALAETPAGRHARGAARPRRAPAPDRARRPATMRL